MRLLIVFLISNLYTSSMVAADSSFSTVINALLCIRLEFVISLPNINSPLLCSLRCHKQPICQAFSMMDGWCKLFVFDKCSKYVRECNCTRTGELYVRKQYRLPAGVLCPSGFGDDNCGTRYKFYAGNTNWIQAMTIINAEAGLVIMADVIDSNELAYIRGLAGKVYNGTKAIMLGGSQLPGSAEPSGGWYWMSCNSSINMNLWHSNEPDDYNNSENNVSIRGNANLYDTPPDKYVYIGCLAECVSPFN